MTKLDRYLLELTEELPDISAAEEAKHQEDLFAQYVQGGTNFPALRRQLAAERRAGQTLGGPKGLRRRLGAIDLEYFGRAYFGHYFRRPSPDFHRELDQLWTSGVMKGLDPATDRKIIERKDGCRKAVAAPRGHAKSTTFTFKDSLHAILYEYKHYLLILSDSTEQAEGFLGDIKAELEENSYILEDFGPLQGKAWTSGCLLTSTGVKAEAIGSGKKVRGRRHRNWRPDLIVLDDIENDENVNTPEQRRKLASWFYKAVSKAGDTYTDIVYIGTILHYDSLLSKVLVNPEYDSVKFRGVLSFATRRELWDAWEAIYIDLTNPQHKEDAQDFYEANRAEMLEGTKVLWPEKQSYLALMIKRISEGEASFNSEIQNDPVDPANCTFPEEWFDFWDQQPEQPDFKDPRFVLIGAVDPSLGKNEKADTNSLINLAKDTTTGYLYVYEASVERRKPDQIIEDAIEMQRRNKRDLQKGFRAFGVETVQFQYFFKDILVKQSAAVGEYLPIEEINNLQNKRLRIEALAPFVKNKYLKFCSKHKTLLQQMREYPMGKNDDGPDGLEMALRLALAVGGGSAGDYRSVTSRVSRFGKGAW
ncbi:MAG: phage terminase large subunit [Peptococcaceae bacterium]|nr:phage terminase large subunit [Peptococcaceae bacterium]